MRPPHECGYTFTRDDMLRLPSRGVYRDYDQISDMVDCRCGSTLICESVPVVSETYGPMSPTERMVKAIVRGLADRVRRRRLEGMLMDMSARRMVR